MSSSSLLFFARCLGFFLLSPLFAKKNVPSGLRFGFAALFTLVLTPPLSFKFSVEIAGTLFWITLIKELVVGYLLGFLFALLFEGAALAGQIVGTLSGFSVTEVLGAGQNNSIFTKLFVLSLFTLLLSLDLHHFLLRFLFESFRAIPVVPHGFSFVDASARLFHHALLYAFVPLVFLSFVLLTFAFIARALPGLQIFWVGFPLQLLVGIVAVTIGFAYFAEILQKAFFEFLTLAKRLFFPL